jgi:hypothetical protein
MDYIPFVAKPQVVSPKFVSILMESCSLTDSVFRHMVTRVNNTASNNTSYCMKTAWTSTMPISQSMVSPLQFVRPYLIDLGGQSE